MLFVVPGAEAFKFPIHRLVLAGGKPAATALAAARFAVAAEAQQTLQDLQPETRGGILIGPPAQQPGLDAVPAVAAGLTSLLTDAVEVFRIEGGEDLPLALGCCIAIGGKNATNAVNQQQVQLTVGSITHPLHQRFERAGIDVEQHAVSLGGLADE